MSLPLVSVVLGVFNGARHVREALESILRQDGVGLELIAVDDGSTDDTPGILDEYAARDSRVRVLHRTHEGLTSALITGCAAARAEFVARQDHDDISLPGRLSKQARLLQSDASLSFVSCWSESVGPDGELLFLNERPSDPAAATRDLLEQRIGPPGHGTVMFRRSAYCGVGGYRRAFYYAQDADLWLRLGAVGKLAYVPEVLYRYSVSDASISGARLAAKKPYEELVTACFEARKNGTDDEALLKRSAPAAPRALPGLSRSSRAATLYFIGRCLLARRDPRAAKYFQRSLWLRPWHPGAWWSLLAASPGKALTETPNVQS